MNRGATADIEVTPPCKAVALPPRTHPRSLMGWLLAATLSLLFVCVGSSMARAASCVSNLPRTGFPFTAGDDNPFGPGVSRTTRFSLSGTAGDALTFQANPGSSGTSQISLISVSNSATLATITVSTSASYVLTAADAAGFFLKFTNNTSVDQTYTVNCIATSVTAAPPSPLFRPTPVRARAALASPSPAPT